MSLVKRNPKHFKNRELKVMNEKTTPADAEHPHSIFGASGAKRWRMCPGSVNLIERAKASGDIPKRTDTEHSKTGTEAHNWSDKVLTGEIKIEEVPDEFRIHLEGYITYCQDIATEAIAAGGKVYHEATVPLFYRPEDVGTLDFAAVTPNQIHFVDLKYGVGVKVDAEENDQLIIYLLSLVESLEKSICEGEMLWDLSTPVSLAIYQPRHHSFDGDADVWVTTLGELVDYGVDIKADYERAKLGDDSALNPSADACQFCDAKGICDARARLSLDPLVDFDDETGPSLKITKGDTLTPSQIAHLITNGKTIKKIIDDVEKHERARIEEGGELRTMKLIDSGGLCPKKWVDEKAAETFLKSQLPIEDRYAPRKVITAPQAFSKIRTRVSELSTIAKAKMGLLDDAAAAKSKTECLFHRAPKAPVMVGIEDERPALNFQPVADEFDDVPDTGDSELDDLM